MCVGQLGVPGLPEVGDTGATESAPATTFIPSGGKYRRSISWNNR